MKARFSRPWAVGIGAVALTTAAAPLIAAGSARAADEATPKVTRTVSEVLGTGGKLARSINYTVNVHSHPRRVRTAEGNGNPLDGTSLGGLPSVPFVGAAGPGEAGYNPTLKNEAEGGTNCPAQGAGHEYLIVWAGKMNAGDMTGSQVTALLTGGAVNPQGLASVAPIQYGETGSDMMATIDAEKGCDTFGKVVNVSVISGPDGIENEPHHMQYSWYPGQSVWAGGLFSSRLFTYDLSSLPKVTLQQTQEPWATPSGSIWDAFATLPNGDAFGTLMGGPLYAYGTTPGSVVEIAGNSHPGKKPGDILGEWASNAPTSLVNDGDGSTSSAMADQLKGAGNSATTLLSKTPEDGGVDQNGYSKCPDFGSCANPHGIQVRKDLNTMVTSDYAEPATLVEDPVKPGNPNEFRRTVRVWSFSTDGCSGHQTPGASVSNPKICSVDVMPAGPRDSANPSHAENMGIMENGSTQNYPLPDGRIPKGWFSESMCGGAVFYTPDITDTAKYPWHEVFDSTAAANAITTGGDGKTAGGGNFGKHPLNEPAGCDGAAWDVVSPDNRFLGHAVNGRYVLQDNYDDAGSPKMVYTISITKLLEAGTHYQCDLNNNIRALADPTRGGKDCPTVAGVVPINDPTSGGPHWASYDNYSLAKIKIKDAKTGKWFIDTHAPTRIAEANYFVARTGVDGNHSVCLIDMDPVSGSLKLDTDFVDETQGTPCVQFNRRDWPDPNIKGFYKPHSMLFVENGAPASGDTPYGKDYGANCVNGLVEKGTCRGYWGEPIDMGADTAGLKYED
jgi:hypothetical protein